MRGAWLAVLGAAALGMAACQDPSGITAAELYGLWGGVSMVYTSTADPGVSVDLVGTEGATYSLRLISGGAYESQLALPGSAGENETGTFEVRSGTLTLVPATGGERRLSIDYNRSLMTLRESDAEWDFDGDGTTEAAGLEIVLDRF